MGDVAVRCFQFQSVSTEIHCRTGTWVGKAERAKRVTGNFAALQSCMQSTGQPVRSAARAWYTFALFVQGIH